MKKNKDYLLKKVQSFEDQIESRVKYLKKNSTSFFELFNKKILTKTKSLKLKPLILIQALQDKTEKLLSQETSYVFLKQSKFWAKSITWVLMGSTAFGICWISIAKTDEVVVARGVLEPKGGVFDVQMPLEGIAREILVKEGELVKKGQVLIRLDTEITEARNNALQKTFKLNESITNKLAYLAKEGAVSEMQYMQQQARLEELKSEIKTNEVTLRYQKIISPIDGIIFELQPKGPGYVARSSQPVLKVVPLKNLQAKVEIDNRSIGFVKIGKKAEISIDSFPATDFGVINGTLKSIGSDSLAPIPSEAKGYRFPAAIELDTQYLKLVNGKRLPLQAGMSLSANIKLRNVTYLQLLLGKFNDKANSLKSIN